MVVSAEELVEALLPSKDQEVTEAPHASKQGSTGSLSPPAALSQSDVPSAAAGHNGSVRNGTLGMSKDGESISPYINGGIINKRFSYSGSLASESVDLSAHRESLSVSSRVSLSVPGLVQLIS